MFKKEYRNWIEYRKLDGRIREYDCHFGQDYGMDYYELMESIYDDVLNIIQNEYNTGGDWVLITHGWSTSRRGNITARSQVRKLMRGKDATPFIDRKRCIQHDSVFVVAIKKNKQRNQKD